MARGIGATGRLRRWSPVEIAQRVLAVAAAATLGVDAYVHFHDAGFYDSVKSSSISQGTLFRVEAVLAVTVGLALLVRPRRRIPWAAALLVAASAFGAVMLYRYVNVGALGPLPNMYEPTWVSPGKLTSAWAEGTGTVIAAIGLFVAIHTHSRQQRPPAEQRELSHRGGRRRSPIPRRGGARPGERGHLVSGRFELFWWTDHVRLTGHARELLS